MSASLSTALGTLASEGPNGLTIDPASPRQLTEALQILGSRGAALHRDALLSRRRLDQLGRVEPRSGTAVVGAGMKLAALDKALSSHGLTLGPLSPRAQALTLGDFLEGPDAGLRSIPGGRLEPLCLGLTLILCDGRTHRSHPSPRSAAGPDLLALVLGAQGRMALITEAVVRCFPIAAVHRQQVFSFPSAEAFVATIQAALSDGVWFQSIRVETRSDRAQVELSCLGTRDGVERDFATLVRRAFEVGGRPSGRLSGEFPIPTTDGKSWEEREATWAAVGAAVAAGNALELHRPALCSVLARGDVEGLSLHHAGAWPVSTAALIAASDSRGVLGGAP